MRCIEKSAPLRSDSADRETDEILLQAYNYIAQVPGVDSRTELVRAFNYWFEISDDKLEQVMEIARILYIADLLLEDIEDGSVVRNGVAVAHNIYGIPSTINAANYAMSVALKKCQTLGHPMALQLTVEELVRLERDRALEVYWRENSICPDETEYCEVAKNKSNGVVKLAIELMRLFSDSTTDCSALNDTLGLYIQIRDDYSSLYSEDVDCLRRGRFTYPVIHAVHARPDDDQVKKILRKQSKGVEDVKYCVRLLKKYGSLEYTALKLSELEGQAREEVRRLGGNPRLEDMLLTLGETLPKE